MRGIDCGEHDRAFGSTRYRETVVHIVWRVQAKTRMPMDGIVPNEECRAGHTRILDGAKARRKVGARPE